MSMSNYLHEKKAIKREKDYNAGSTMDEQNEGSKEHKVGR